MRAQISALGWKRAPAPLIPSVKKTSACTAKAGFTAEVDQRVGSRVRARHQHLCSLVHVEGVLEPEELFRQPTHRRGGGGVGVLAQLREGREGLGHARRAVRSDAEDDHRLRVLARVAKEHAAHAGVRDLRFLSEALEDVLAVVATL
jgi:hypothetical protein